MSTIGTWAQQAPAPVISLSSNLLNFTYQTGGNLPPSQTIIVSGCGVCWAGVENSAAGGGWLAVSPETSTGSPTPFNIYVNPAGLRPGSYNGTIIFTVFEASNSPQSVSIVLTVGGAPGSGNNGSQTYTINTVAGNGNLNAPQGVTLDSAGNIYIADEFNYRILKVTNGVITTVAGNGDGFGGDGGPATSAQLNDPYGVAVDSAGNIYIADSGNSRIRILTPTGSSCTYVVAPTSLQVPAAGGNLTLSIQTTASCPWALSGLPSWITVASATSGTISATVSLAVAANPGQARSATIAVASVSVQVTQQGGYLPCTYALSPSDQTFPVAGGTGSVTVTATVTATNGCSWTASSDVSWVTFTGSTSGTGNGTVTYQVAANTGGARSGNLSVAGLPFVVQQSGTVIAPANMAGNWQFSARSTMFGLAFSVTGQIAQTGNSVSGQLSITGTPCATTATFTGTLSSSGALAMNLNENGQAVVFSGTLAPDGNSGSGSYSAASGGCTNGDRGIWSGQRVSTSTGIVGGVISTVAGNGTQGFGGDGGPAISAVLDNPSGVAVDSAGNVYMADSNNERIRRVSTSGTITTVAGNGKAGFSGDGGPATSAELNIGLYEAAGGIAVDGAGNLYIADTSNNRIRKVSTNAVITTVAGNGTQGFSGDGGLATSAELYMPHSVAVDRSGNLYIADYDERIRKVSTSGVITTIAGNGNAGFSWSDDAGAPATSAELNTPLSVAVDGAGNVYIADQQNNRVRKVSPGGIISTVAGSGSPGLGWFSGDGGPATSGQLNNPTGVAVDGAGNLYIADEGNNRVRQVSTGGIITTVAGKGDGSCSGDGGPAVAAGLSPTGVTVDSMGNLYISDGLGCVRMVHSASTSGPSLSAMQNAGSNSSGPISPGEIVVLYGTRLGPAQLTVATIGTDGLYDTQLAGTSVAINGIQAPMIYTSATQVSVIAPYGITRTTAQITAKYQGQTSAAFSVAIASSAPGVFTSSSTGSGQAAAINQDGITINGVASPAKVGDVISLYATGEGQTTPLGVDGKPATVPLPRPNLLVSATIGGQPAQVLYAGGAPGEVAGLMQVNVQIPVGIQTGNAVPVVLSVGNVTSQVGVTIAVR